MGGEANSAVWSLLGTLVGAAASIGTTWLANAHSAKLEAQRSREARAEVARAFQRQTLSDLLEAIHQLVRHSSDAYSHEIQTLEAGGSWKSRLPAETLMEAVRAALRAVVVLNQRVADDPTREQVAKFVRDIAEALDAENPTDAAVLRTYALEQFHAVTTRVGTVLRSQYEKT